MAFLRILEGIRNPLLDNIMSVITYLGDQMFFMVLAFILYWCTNKRNGYYILLSGFFSITVGQTLKMLFRVPRPWIKDPDFTIVESAREGAAGYSFPSGHTQNSVATFTSVALAHKNKIIHTLCILGIILVPFSRMYLGVHTPLDVGVGFAISLIIAMCLYPCFKSEEAFEKSAPLLMTAATVLSIAFVVFMSVYPFPADVEAAKITESLSNGCKMLGAVIGFDISCFLDRKYVRFKTAAPISGQALKLILGTVLLLIIKSAVKTPLLTLTGNQYISDTVRYFIVAVLAGIVWPMTFKFFAKIGKRN